MPEYNLSGDTLVMDGGRAASDILNRCRVEVETLKARHSILPGLAVVRVGEEPSSVSYAGRIVSAFADAGLSATVVALPETATRGILQAELHRLNVLPEFAGVLVQWPLPAHLQWDVVIDVLDPAKDVDGSHPLNIGRLYLGLDSFVPATPAGGIALLDFYGVSIEGKRALVIGRSNIVGKPLSQLLLARNATVTIAHSRSRDLEALSKEADILASAAGSPGLVRASMIKPGASVLDFGASYVDGRIRGDVDFDSALGIAGAISPVPGGTGPMTNAMLLKNTLTAIRRGLSGTSGRTG